MTGQMSRPTSCRPYGSICHETVTDSELPIFGLKLKLNYKSSNYFTRRMRGITEHSQAFLEELIAATKSLKPGTQKTTEETNSTFAPFFLIISTFTDLRTKLTSRF